MCGPPDAYMAPAYEPEEDVENGNNTDHAEEERMPRASPVTQQSLQGWEVCRVAVSCSFALDILYSSVSGKQGSERRVKSAKYADGSTDPSSTERDDS